MKNILSEKMIIAEKIKNYFLKRIDLLDPGNQRHLMVRLYRISGDKSCVKPITKNFLDEKPIEDLSNLYNKSYVTRRSDELFARLKKKNGMKAITRRRTFRNKKEFLFYYQIVEHLYFMKTFGIPESKLNKQFEDGKRFLRKINFKKYVLNEDAIKYFGTQLVNCVHYLKVLKITDLKGKFRERFIKIFMDERKKLPGFMFKNRIYGLAHFVFTESEYYQRFVSYKKFKWVIDYFKGDINRILRKTDMDIICEVGLCFKLCKINSGKHIDLITNYLLNKYDEKLGYIPRKGNRDINALEHTNILAYLFLCDFKKLHKGPDLGLKIG